jgi:hypothetical protein
MNPDCRSGLELLRQPISLQLVRLHDIVTNIACSVRGHKRPSRAPREALLVMEDSLKVVAEVGRGNEERLGRRWIV